MSATLTEREEQIRAIIRQHGYEVQVYATCCRVYVRPTRLSSGYSLPWTFRSVQAVADHLIPVIHDDAFTAEVSAL